MPMSKFIRVGFVAPILLFVLLGCPTSPPVLEPLTASEIAARETRLMAFTSWRALGSLVVDSEDQGALNASFAWDGRADGFDIKLFGPLGVQTLQVVESSDGARLLSRKNDEVNGASAERLLLEELGVQIPLRGMQRWVVGLQGLAEQVDRDVAGRITQMVVRGDEFLLWKVIFKSYMEVDGLDLPKSIKVIGNGLDINLKVRKWIKLDFVPKERLLIPGLAS